MTKVDETSLKTVAEARGHILEQIEVLDAESMLIDTAVGRVLAADVISPADSPRFDNSAMDGYAVYWQDVAAVSSGQLVTLPVTSVIAAGDGNEVAIAAGSAARIMTGARLPSGPDTVIMREDTDEGDDQVTVTSLPKNGCGSNIRRRGTYFCAGTPLVRAGARVDAGLVGILASVGRCVLAVHRLPRVAVLSTGDELVELDQTPGPGQIINSSAYMLSALVREAGGLPVVHRIVSDDYDECFKAFKAALRGADLVISTGGVSVGDFDVVRSVLTALNTGMGFWRVNMKPGKPLAFGIVNGCPLIGLPGNPVSSFVAFRQFVRPAIRKLRGEIALDPLLVRARLTKSLRSTPWRADYQRGHLCQTPQPTLEGEAQWAFTPAADQSSANLTSVVNTNGIAVIPEGISSLIEGDSVEVEVLRLGGLSG